MERTKISSEVYQKKVYKRNKTKKNLIARRKKALSRMHTKLCQLVQS
jgi:hypothetical protein